MGELLNKGPTMAMLSLKVQFVILMKGCWYFGYTKSVLE